MVEFGIPDDFSIVVTYRGEIITGMCSSYSLTSSFSNSDFNTMDIHATIFPDAMENKSGIIVPKTIQQASTDVLLNESFKRIKARVNK